MNWNHFIWKYVSKQFQAASWKHKYTITCVISWISLRYLACVKAHQNALLRKMPQYINHITVSFIKEGTQTEKAKCSPACARVRHRRSTNEVSMHHGLRFFRISIVPKFFDRFGWTTRQDSFKLAFSFFPHQLGAPKEVLKRTPTLFFNKLSVLCTKLK